MSIPLAAPWGGPPIPRSSSDSRLPCVDDQGRQLITHKVRREASWRRCILHGFSIRGGPAQRVELIGHASAGGVGGELALRTRHP